MEEIEQKFDSLFTAAETKELHQSSNQGEMEDLQRQVLTTITIRMVQGVSQASSRQGSRGGSGQGSRGSPARKPPTNPALCPSNPAVTGIKSTTSRSHSMKDQTGHMREKYQSKRRLSTKNSSPVPLSVSRRGSRNNSLPNDEVEVTRQFLTTNKKVINRGDSFKRREHPVTENRSHVEINSNDSAAPDERVGKQPVKVYRVLFLGSSEVGKTSIIEQFMSSEHADVYDEGNQKLCDRESDSRDMWTVMVDVNGEESRLSLVESREEDLTRVVEINPDCYVVVYAMDNEDSFEYAKKTLDWLTSSNSLAGKSSILVGNKADLARSRLVETVEGCDLAVEFGVKFTETSPGMGHHIDELLVGIVMQMRLQESGSHSSKTHTSIKQTVKGFFNSLQGKEEEKRKSCRNLNT